MAGVFGGAALIGVAAGRESDAVPIVIAILCLVAIATLSSGRARWLAALGACGLAGGALIAGFHESTIDQRPVPATSTVRGRIDSDPRLAGGGLVVELEWTDASGRVVTSPLIVPATSGVGRGDRVTVSLVEGRDASELLVAASLDLVAPAGRVEGWRRSIRARVSDLVLDHVPGSSGSLALGLLIGDDSGLTVSERDAVRASGLSHITAVSGSNVAMVIFVVAFLLRGLRGRFWLWIPIQLAAIGFYVWIVGAEPPIVRAAIMGSLALVAIGLGRPSHLFSLLLLAAGVMALLDPDVVSSLSFQLSFLSMLALGVASGRVQRLEGRAQPLVAVVALPAAAALATAPLIAMRFGTLSLGTIPANVVVAPIIAPATALSGFVAALGDVPVAGSIVATLTWLATGFILEVAMFVSDLPGSYWVFDPPGSGATVLLYLLLAGCAAPFVPEARLLAHRTRRWAELQPAAAFSSATAGLALLWALASTAN